MSVRVPFATAGLRRKAVSELSHARRVNEGEWRFVLRTRSPLCIRTLYDDLRPNQKVPFISGSSLRGMFRNMVEVIGAGCGQLFLTGDPPREFRRCTRATGLCLACRLFGTVEETRDPLVWMGKVTVLDSGPAAGWSNESWQDCPMFGDREPKAPEANEWILFEKTGRQPKAGTQLSCVPAETEFRFRVWWRDLDEEEAAVLQFAITLRHGDDAFYHKLGFGKAMGLGSVEIDYEEGQVAVSEVEMDRYTLDAGVWDTLREHRSGGIA